MGEISGVKRNGLRYDTAKEMKVPPTLVRQTGQLTALH